MTLLTIFAKIIFFPIYLIALFVVVLLWLKELAFGDTSRMTFDEILCRLNIDTYWEL